LDTRYYSAEKARLGTTVRRIDRENPAHRLLPDLVRRIEWLLRQKHLNPGLEFLHRSYQAVLAAMGFVTRAGSVRMAELREHIIKFYGPSLRRAYLGATGPSPLPRSTTDSARTTHMYLSKTDFKVVRTCPAKPFAEGYLLAEIFAQQLEARAVRVTRRFGLGGTEIIFPALVKGDVDLYPEYTGTGVLVMLKQPAPESSAAVFDLVAREFAARYDLRWLPPLGFENTYAMSVLTGQAQELGLQTLSDFARVSECMRAGFTAAFIGLPDGLPMLRERYGPRLREVNALAPAVEYQALTNDSMDIIDAYSTDGLLGRHPVTVLEYDRRAFPPYDAAALVRGEVWRTRPDVIAALRLPLAAPVIMAGIRTAAVLNVGTATLAAFIGAGGWGTPSSPVWRWPTRA
jgi:glycine betaine/choline ABC-type transport system substrate-binding protein